MSQTVAITVLAGDSASECALEVEGRRSTSRLWREFPHACTACSAGTWFVFQR